MWIVSFCHPDPESGGAFSMEIGAKGTYIDAQGCVHAYFTAEPAARDAQAKMQSIGATNVALAYRCDENWSALCTDLWQPLGVGTLSVVPTFDEYAAKLSDARTLQILPGQGFGTGHHATTYSMLELLQESHFKKFKQPRIADIGTGSGILALGALALYGGYAVGLDNDFAALSNARVNKRLNVVGQRLSLACGELASLDGKFEIVCANLYTSLLTSLKEGISSLVVEGGALLLSGFQEPDEPLLEAVFAPSPGSFKIIARRARSGWSALLCVRE